MMTVTMMNGMGKVMTMMLSGDDANGDEDGGDDADEGRAGPRRAWKM